MKLLPLKNKLESLKYLLKIQLPFELFVWIAGYGAEPGSVWNEEKSRAMFNKIKAAKFPDHKLTKNILKKRGNCKTKKSAERPKFQSRRIAFPTDKVDLNSATLSLDHPPLPPPPPPPPRPSSSYSSSCWNMDI